MLAAMALTLVACGSKPPAPVFDLTSRHSPSTQTTAAELTLERAESISVDIPDIYVVKPGDTLFSIAWYYSKDHKELAKINGIRNNTIYPGQKLKLKSIQNQLYFDSDSLIAALNEEVLNQPVSGVIIKAPGAASDKPDIKQARISVRNATQSKKPRVSKIQKIRSSSSRVARRAQTNHNNSLNWIWPTDGKILSRFSSKINASRGLDIAGAKGQPVRASAPGKVVYEGNGLKGYGNLVIIKHNNDYLSAYAHNDKVYVSENEVVKAGQRIADIGSSGTKSEKLHFEIRYKGKPVDPLNYLPER